MGFYIGTELLEELMTSHLMATLEARLLKAKLKHYSLNTRVTIANQLIISANYFMLQLWIGDVEQLVAMDKEVAKFVWIGSDKNYRPRVDYDTITRSKVKGGLGLISFKDENLAHVGKKILWAGTKGKEALQCIIREK